MDTRIEITLDEFVFGCLQELEAFEDYWRRQQQKHDNFPGAMRIQEWREQLAIWGEHAAAE